MSAFIDDFFEGDEYDNSIIESLFNKIPALQEEYDNHIIFYNDLKASINNEVYLYNIDEFIPIREINIMIERMNYKSKFQISKYAIYRDCEDYLVKTDWFFQLQPEIKYKIQYDFYTHVVKGVNEAYLRIG